MSAESWVAFGAAIFTVVVTAGGVVAYVHNLFNTASREAILRTDNVEHRLRTEIKHVESEQNNRRHTNTSEIAAHFGEVEQRLGERILTLERARMLDEKRRG